MWVIGGAIPIEDPVVRHGPRKLGYWVIHGECSSLGWIAPPGIQGGSLEAALPLSRPGTMLIPMTNLVRDDVAEEWCASCGTRHSPVSCSGEVLATEPERHAWRGSFARPDAAWLAIGVLLARCDRGWRARVLTYPRSLWTVPGSTCTVKFVAETADEAELQARKFVEEHCEQRGYEAVRDKALVAPVKSFPREQTKHAEGLESSRRRVCEMRVRLAIEGGPAVAGTVVLASERGLFVRTEGTASIGDSIRIQAELDGVSFALGGDVRSVQTEASPGRPRGIGVGLTDPPARYVSYVQRLA